MKGCIRWNLALKSCPRYRLPCDIWSLGVIVYMLLSGTPPFVGDSDWETTELVKRAKYSLKGPRWAELSEKAKHFVHSLLRKDPNDRLTASEAQEHSWLNWKNKGAQASASIDTKVLRDMSQFAATNTITRTALGLLAHQTSSGIAGEEDLKSLEDQFKKLDVSRSGQIKIALAVLTTIRPFLPLTFFSFSEISENS